MMPVFDFELNEIELNKIKNKVIETISKDIDSIVRKSVISITKDEASAHLLKQITPKITDYTNRIRKITSEEGLNARIEKLVKRSICKELQEARDCEVYHEVRSQIKNKIQQIEIPTHEIENAIENQAKIYIQSQLDYKFGSFTNEIIRLVELLKSKVDLIHKNQDFLAKKLEVIE